jgi:hypothetical protein
MVPGLRSDHPPKISLAGTGLPQKLAGASAMDAPVNIKKWALWAALLAAVALLAWMAWRLSAQMRRSDVS